VAARLPAVALFCGERLVSTGKHEGAVEHLARHRRAVEAVWLARRMRKPRVPDRVVARLRWLGDAEGILVAKLVGKGA